MDNEIQDLSNKILQSENSEKKITIASHQSDQNLIEDNMEVEVKVELISVKPAPTTTSTAVDLTGGIIQERHVSHDVGVGKCKLPPTNSLQSGVPPAAKQCQNDNSSNENAMSNQSNLSNVTATKLTIIQKYSYNVVVPQPISGTIAGNHSEKKMRITHDQIFNLVTHCLDDAEIEIFLSCYNCIKTKPTELNKPVRAFLDCAPSFVDTSLA